MVEHFIARQPIYTTGLDVFAYELLCRTGTSDSCTTTDGVEATSQVILAAFAQVGPEKLGGQHPVLIKMPHQFLLAGYHLACPAHRVYLEVMAGEQVTPELEVALQRLLSQGYRLALHGLPERTEAGGILDRVDLIKLDMRRLGKEKLSLEVHRAKRYLGRLCAEKVETQAEFEECKKLGIPSVQGYFFCRPRMQGAKQLLPNRLALLQLMAKFNDPKVTIDELTRLISQDVALTVKLLQTLNSAFFGLPRKIDSIRQGMVLLGSERIRAWASVMVLSRLVDKPHELMRIALARAKMCERLAFSTGLSARAESLFMVGLFSVLDAIMDMPMSFVMEKLPLVPDVALALTSHGSQLGPVLECVLAYERGEFDKVDHMPMRAAAVRTAYLEAVAWADGACRQFLQDGRAAAARG